MSEFGRIFSAMFLTVAVAGCVTLPTGMTASSGQQCDPGKSETTPLSRFRIDETAGTVFDTQTKLTWKRCAEGQTYKAGRCEGEAGKWKWDEAVKMFGVRGNDWRLPNVDELSSIVERRCENPTINSQVFPNSPAIWFWSGSVFELNPNHAWYVGFYKGGTYDYDHGLGSAVRLVQGQQWINPLGIIQNERKVAQDRMAREAEEAQLREIKQREAEEEKRRKHEELKVKIAELVEAERSAVFFCPDKAACDKAFSLTQIYLNQTSDMKIQVATDAIVETYNPNEDGKLGLKAIRIPGKGTSAMITLSASCRDEKGFHVESCRLGKIQAYKGFRPFIEQMLK